MKNLDLAYPVVSPEQKKALELASFELEKQGIIPDPVEKEQKKEKKDPDSPKKKKKGKKKK
jgi:hypothetical protein